MPDALHCLFQCGRQFQPALAVALQQMKRHPLRTLSTHAGQAAQCFDQVGKEG
jgi:hypothetical protein